MFMSSSATSASSPIPSMARSDGGIRSALSITSTGTDLRRSSGASWSSDQDTDSYLLALNKDTGKVEWKVERPESTRSYSTPAILRPKNGPAELIVPGAYYLTSYNANTGEKLW